MKRIYLLATLLIITFLLLFLFRLANNKFYRRTRLYMGTTLEFNMPVTKKSMRSVKKACNIAESKIAELDNALSIFNPDSLISTINNDNKKRVVQTPKELFELVKRAKEYFILTQGAFDITVEPLTEAWGFGPEKKTAPDEQAIKDILTYVGLDKIEIDEKNQTLVFKDPHIKMDFGGLAKGYAVDEAVAIFKRGGITRGIINMGGDLYCMGRNIDGRDWTIGIKDPEDKKEILASLRIHDKAIATSGDYENYYIYDNKRYTHIIDPRIGYTVTNNLRSVTIIADDCTTADALATAIFVLGESKGPELVERLAGVECLLVVSRGDKIDIVMSNGMEEYIKK